MAQVSEPYFCRLSLLNAQLVFHPIGANHEHCKEVLYEEFGIFSDEDDCKNDF
jgi:hypothetical protein